MYNESPNPDITGGNRCRMYFYQYVVIAGEGLGDLLKL
jgi:hypothetical protein